MILKKLSKNLLNTVLTNEVAFPICNNILTNKTGITKMAFLHINHVHNAVGPQWTYKMYRLFFSHGQ